MGTVGTIDGDEIDIGLPKEAQKGIVVNVTGDLSQSA
jgi:hypothetical protein